MIKRTYEVVKPNQIVFEGGNPVRLEVGTTYVTTSKINGDRVKLIDADPEKPKAEVKLEVATPSKPTEPASKKK